MGKSYDTLGSADHHDHYDERPKFYQSRKFKIFLSIGAFMILFVLVVVLLSVFLKEDEVKPYPSLANAISVSAMMGHLEQLYLIAQKNNGSRTAITGYNASVDFVVQTLTSNTDYQITLQNFQFPYFMEVQPPVFNQTFPAFASFEFQSDFQNIRYAGGGSVIGKLAFVNGGCNIADYQNANFSEGKIAFLVRGYLLDCNMTQKFEMAISQKAAAIVIMNDPTNVGLFSAGLKTLQPIIGFAITYPLGLIFQNVLDVGELEVSLFANNIAPIVQTTNVIADTTSGDATNIIVVGSHLDSVIYGPGINDDGSGSALNLELAIQLYKTKIPLTNKVRFSWWAGEELGLLGSTYYVSTLSPQDMSNIALNINLDMVASPNYFYGIYNGSSGNANIKNGSTTIQNLISSYFTQNNIPYQLTGFDGRSDYGPFIAVGIPAGGIFTGAEGIKTVAQRTMFGGVANAAYDPCYHLACDTIDNIDQGAYGVTSKAAATTLETLATTNELRNYLASSSSN